MNDFLPCTGRVYSVLALASRSSRSVILTGPFPSDINHGIYFIFVEAALHSIHIVVPVHYPSPPDAISRARRSALRRREICRVNSPQCNVLPVLKTAHFGHRCGSFTVIFQVDHLVLRLYFHRIVWGYLVNVCNISLLMVPGCRSLTLRRVTQSICALISIHDIERLVSISGCRSCLLVRYKFLTRRGLRLSFIFLCSFASAFVQAPMWWIVIRCFLNRLLSKCCFLLTAAIVLHLLDNLRVQLVCIGDACTIRPVIHLFVNRGLLKTLSSVDSCRPASEPFCNGCILDNAITCDKFNRLVNSFITIVIIVTAEIDIVGLAAGVSLRTLFL